MLPEITTPLTEPNDSIWKIGTDRYISKEDFFVSNSSNDDTENASEDENERVSKALQSSGKSGIYSNMKAETSPTVVETFSVSDAAVNSIPPTDSYFYTSTFEKESKDSLEFIDRYMPDDRFDEDREREDECPTQDSLLFSQTRTNFHISRIAMECRTRIMESASSDSNSYNAAREKSLFDDDDDDDQSLDLNQKIKSPNLISDNPMKPVCINSFINSVPNFPNQINNECNLKDISFQPVLEYTSSLQVRHKTCIASLS
jgi:hypothetical protein